MTQSTSCTKLDALLVKGVQVPLPATVWVGDEVNPERISSDVVLFPGARLEGKHLSIGPGCKIGSENPATVINSQLQSDVEIKGGFVTDSVFLAGSSVGSANHIRGGCLFEEEASTAHAVGCKQTILMSFVKLGSLINFCDCLMCGGTSRKNHSEVGSSFIHFNFTPHADKATASCFGDVPRGVLLDQPPIFLGGQGGVVGPVQTEFGVVQAAGSICRRDLDENGFLYQSAVREERWMAYQPGTIRDPDEKCRKNLEYLGALSALRLWYRCFRRQVMLQDDFTTWALDGAETLLISAQKERVKQLTKWIKMVPASEGPSFEDLSWLADVETLLTIHPEPEELRTISNRIERTTLFTQAVSEIAQADRETVVRILRSEVQRFTRIAGYNPEETHS